MNALAHSIVPLSYLSLMTFSVVVFFALVGMELFVGALHGGCYANFSLSGGIYM